MSAMVRQARVVFDLTDVVAVRLQCAECGNEVVQRVERTVNAPTVCPICEKSWAVARKGLPVHTLLAQICELVANHDELPSVVRFEFPDDGDSSDK
ncbi:MAG: hypothetical protein OXG33_04310 [Chloroflexi bacterium]|nr:hypothetical protein [Chloroflexota bacterium]